MGYSGKSLQKLPSPVSTAVSELQCGGVGPRVTDCVSSPVSLPTAEVGWQPLVQKYSWLQGRVGAPQAEESPSMPPARLLR